MSESKDVYGEMLTLLDNMVVNIEGEHTDSKPNMLDYIGIYGPIIGGAIGVFHLWRMPKYLIGFVLFYILNEVLCVFLKQLIHEPRPQIYVSDPANRTYYGMPSGHAQHSAFIIVYLWLVKPSWMVTCLCLTIGSMSMVERYKNKRHTLKQLLAGIIIGSIFAIWSVYVVRKTLELS